jgi:hypothetical protein
MIQLKLNWIWLKQKYFRFALLGWLQLTATQLLVMLLTCVVILNGFKTESTTVFPTAWNPLKCKLKCQ